MTNSHDPARMDPPFRGFPELRSNVLYCPKQFFTVVIPNSSVNCIRVVSYMLRKTLGWVDEAGDPLHERHDFSFREMEEAAGITRSCIGEALDDAREARFIRQVQEARIQTHGVRGRSAYFELCWDENRYTDRLEGFEGFFLQPTYLDSSGQTRLGRKNIPNAFFDHLIRNESRRVIRVVGTLLWYSIDWGKGGERKQPVKKSLRDLVELTQIGQCNVVRALDEAQEKGYIERIERGVFDLTAGNTQGSTTVYGIRWATGQEGERSEKDTQGTLRKSDTENAPKKSHGERFEKVSRGTLRKSHTENAPKKSAGTLRKSQPGNASKKSVLVTTNSYINNTPIQNSSNSSADASASAAAVVEEALFKSGFDPKTASDLACAYPAERIFRQIASLPQRRPTKNRLGMLRQSIVEDWAPPVEVRSTDDAGSQGKTFAANFYAGYHGNSGEPVSDPSDADAEAAEKFVKRLFEVSISGNVSDVPGWGRQFGMFAAREHGQNRQSFPALRPAIQRHGDDFYARFKASFEAERRHAMEQAQQAHYEKFHGAYQDYLREELARQEAMNSGLFQNLLAEENGKIQAQYPVDRLERFERLIILEEGHGVLDFWTWDKL